MKKVLNHLRSMRTANILLILVALLCGLSSLLPQGRGLPFYAENYPKLYTLIYRSHFYDVFGSWYFLLIMGLLCLSMAVCTGNMFLKALRSGKAARERAASLPDAESLGPGGLEKLRLYMASIRCREEKHGDTILFYKNEVGRWGVFLLHLAILLTVIFGVCALALPEVTDIDCRTGETVTLEDGAQLQVDSFSMKNAGGQLDYASVVRLTLPDGSRSAPREVKVNYPMTFGRYKVFQWTYGVGASILARSLQDGSEQRFDLDETATLSSDGGQTGLLYLGLYEARAQEDGEDSFVFYRVSAIGGGMMMPERDLRPGESLTVGDWEFTFLDPYFAGLRVKKMPFPLANSLLEGAFLLMLAGMFLCFYLPPVLVKADEKGYTVTGPRPEKIRLELKKLLQEQEGEKA